MNKKIILVFLFFLVFSCNNYSNYGDKFKIYYHTTFNRYIESENDLYMFLPLNSCSSCINHLIDFLSKNDKSNSIHIIFVYRSKAFFNIKKKYLKNYDFVLDKKLQAIEIGIIDGSKPVLIEFKKGELLNVTEVEININWEESLGIINKYFN